MGDSSRRPSAPPLVSHDSGKAEIRSSSGPVSISQEPRDSRTAKPKRTVVHVACLVCRRLRIKCDGNRPTCLPCKRRGETCEYDIEANTTRSNALKRKNEDLGDENTQLRELYSFLKHRPLFEAEEILRRIRNTDDPLEVYRHVVTADMLMDQRVPATATATPTTTTATTNTTTTTNTNTDTTSASSPRENKGQS